MTTSTKRLVVIVGPTGSGKTDLSIRIALHYGAPILSTDSRQMYRGLPIGTAQPTADQLQAVEHHFIASHDLADNLSCGEYETQALACLERLFAGHDCVVAVGGSGLYVKALCEGMDDLPQADENLRRELAARLRTEGLEALAGQLRTLDPDYYAVVDRSNPARVVRALEVCLQTGLSATGSSSTISTAASPTTRPWNLSSAIRADMPNGSLPGSAATRKSAGSAPTRRGRL